MFVQYLAEKAHDVVKSETKKPRRNVQYRDVATAIARFDNLEFLENVVPRTVKWGDVKRRQEAERAKREVQGGGVNGGQTTLGFVKGEDSRVDKQRDGQEEMDGRNIDDDEDEDAEDSDDETMDMDSGPAPGRRQIDDAADHQLEMEMRGPRMNGAGNSARADTVGNGRAMA